MKQFILTVAILTSVSVAYSAEPSDTTKKVTELKEVVVEGANHYVSAQKSTYIPTKREKNASADPYELLGRMQIPELRVNGNDVKDVMHNDVPIFIDGHPAGPQELQGMRMTDVLRVEYLINPSDPQYQHFPTVLNFIMKKYEWGGYTKLYGIGTWLPYTSANSETLFAFSRYARKNHQLDVWANGGNTYSKHFGTVQRQDFALPDVSVTRYEDAASGRRNVHRAEAGLDHQYTNPKTNFWFGQFLVWDLSSTPLNSNQGTVSYTSDRFQSGTSSLRNPAHWQAIQYHASVSIPLSHGWGMHYETDFQHKHNDT